MKKGLYGLGIFMLCSMFFDVALAAKKPKPLIDDDLVHLGKLVYFDEDFSKNQNQSCASCHHPTAAFSDPVNRISPMYRPVSEGSVAGLFGGRNAPPAAYAAFSPPMSFVGELFIGGVFWDGRASGISKTDTAGPLNSGPLGATLPTLDTLADQAKGPFGNPVEMALPNPVIDVVALVGDKYDAEYAAAWDSSTAADGNEIAYNRIALAISAFEKSTELNRFSSKFDAFRLEQGGDVSGFVTVTADFASDVYTLEEAEGLALFNNPEKGNCAACHPTADHNATTPPVFTDFSYDNLGIPKNPNVDTLAGPQPIDYGLGAQVTILEEAYGGPLTKEDLPTGLAGGGTITVVSGEEGKFKVSSLRNIARTAPYGHNGFFPTLYDIVHFYNTRDVAAWPPPEVLSTVNDAELGDLGLTFEEEQKIVVFLETLTDQ